jgi:6-phosphogluconate dehydrogenase
MADIGLIGLGVMGGNLVKNLVNHGYRVMVYNRSTQKSLDLAKGDPTGNIIAALTMPEFIAGLNSPRCILLMVSAGQAVDSMLDQLRPLLSPGDVVIDGGNSYYKDSERREAALTPSGIHFIGMGISGGSEGALRGPSMMPGGSQAGYAVVEPILKAVTAHAADGQACVAYLGKGGAGHFVKMVHNGIEYAIMQAIAESYALLRTCGDMSAAKLADLYASWNRDELASYLVEITAHIFTVRDPQKNVPLVDLILDKAAQKGTGQWTSLSALELGVPANVITAAVDERVLTSQKEERVNAAHVLSGPNGQVCDQKHLEASVRAALYAAMIIAYAQGFNLLRAAAQAYGYSYPLADVARIWRGGCIIRAALLEDFYAAYTAQPDLVNLLLAQPLAAALAERQTGWRDAIEMGVQNGVSLPVMSAALAYYDSYRSVYLPANLVQAQRDFFGSHTYERIDQAGTFHTDW